MNETISQNFQKIHDKSSEARTKIMKLNNIIQEKQKDTEFLAKIVKLMQVIEEQTDQFKQEIDDVINISKRSLIDYDDLDYLRERCRIKIHYYDLIKNW